MWRKVLCRAELQRRRKHGLDGPAQCASTASGLGDATAPNGGANGHAVMRVEALAPQGPPKRADQMFTQIDPLPSEGAVPANLWNRPSNLVWRRRCGSHEGGAPLRALARTLIRPWRCGRLGCRQWPTRCPGAPEAVQPCLRFEAALYRVHLQSYQLTLGGPTAILIDMTRPSVSQSPFRPPEALCQNYPRFAFRGFGPGALAAMKAAARLARNNWIPALIAAAGLRLTMRAHFAWQWRPLIIQADSHVPRAVAAAAAAAR